MKKGTCKMCLTEKDLVRSHLMPAALYDYCRKNGISSVRVGNGVVMHTDRETQDHLLCLKCEDVLNSGGEKWVNPKLATIDPRTFPLYDCLVKSPAIYEDGKSAMYCTRDNREIDVQKVTHFALGIFWKASVHSWKGDDVRMKIDLGEYSNDIRKWLRGESSFPNDVYLQVGIQRTQRAQIIMKEPSQTTLRTHGSFWMHVPGMYFLLDIGPGVPIETQRTCFWNSPENLIVVSEELTAFVERLFANEYLQTRKAKSYLLAQAKRIHSETEKPSSSK